MDSLTSKTFAILGGGPAGATMATLLAKQGHRVALFHTPKRPALIVGESLLPAVIPMLRELGIEEKVKSFSVHKPGATVCLGKDEVISASFLWAGGTLPPYAYNTQRDLFDQTVLDAAVEAGAKLFHAHAQVQKSTDPNTPANTIELTQATLDATNGFLTSQPDMIIDATGRLRLVAKLLDIPYERGGRDDVALFAHLDNAHIDDPGHVHVDYLTKGWGWRIPLPGKVSVGVVIKPEHLKAYGNSIEEQYDNFLRDEPSLKHRTQNSKRLTPVVKYQNYQIVSDKMHGPNWATLGDAAGFLDPVFSTGLYLGMKSAFCLSNAIDKGTPKAMLQYEKKFQWELRLWQGIIRSWYDGRLFNLYRSKDRFINNFLGKQIDKRFRRRLGRIFNGQAVDELGRMKLFDYLTTFGTLLRDQSDLVVK